MRTTDCLAVLLIAQSLAAQSSRPAPSKSPPVVRMEGTAQSRVQGRYVLEAGEHRLRDLVQRSAQLLDRTELVQWSESREGGDAKVTLQVRVDLDRAGFEELMTQLLWSRDWVLTCVDADKQVFEWIHVMGPRVNLIMKRASRQTPAEVQARPGLATAVTTQVRLQNTDPFRVANTLRPRLGSNRLGCDPVDPVPASKTLLVHGIREDVITTLRLIESLDNPVPDAPNDPPAGGGVMDPAGAAVDRMAALEARVQRLEKLIAELQRK